MRGLLFLAPAALALQPMKPVSYDAFELAAAEALKDELRANYQKRAARERSMRPTTERVSPSNGVFGRPARPNSA